MTPTTHNFSYYTALVLLLVWPLSLGAQQLEFVLTESGYPIDSERCLSKDTEYESLQISVIGEQATSLTDATLTIRMEEEMLFYESYLQFDGPTFFDWLDQYKAFRKEVTISMEFLYTLTSGNRQQYALEFCVNRSGEVIVMSEGPGGDNYVKLPVFFATDRNYDETQEDFEDQFGSQRSSLKYGWCTVSIPNTHEVGQIESPSIWKFEFWEDPAKHIVIHKVDLLQKDSFFRKLSSRVKKSNGKQSFLFVHGYNVSFTDAAKRTAQMAYDLGFDGEPVFYSWPSKASTSAYTNDEATIQWSKLNMERFLEDYIERSEAEQIYLIAHSMGNRGLTRALIDLLQEKPHLKEKIQEVILAAPDIDADVFKEEIAPKMVENLQSPVTLYVSAEDAALLASDAVHGYRRAGDSRQGVLVVDGIETIDATGLDESFLGHSYFSETKPILNDILEIINTSKRAARRRSLEKQQQDEGVYWKIKSN